MISKEDQYKAWFRKLHSGTTSYRYVQEIARNEDCVLIRVVHPGGRGVWGNWCSQITEWQVLDLFCKLSQIGLYPESPLFSRKGRLLKCDKELIKEKFGLEIPKFINTLR